MAHHIFPTTIGTGTWGGSTPKKTWWIREGAFRDYNDYKHRCWLPNMIYSGLGLSNPSGLNIDVAAGKATVGGYAVNSDATTTVTLQNGDNYVVLRVLRFADEDTAYDLEIVREATQPDWDEQYELFLGYAYATGGTITSYSSTAGIPRMAYVSYTGNGNSDRTIFLGFRPRAVIVVGSITGGRIYSMGGIYNMSLDSSATLTGPGASANRWAIPEISAAGFIVSDHVSFDSLNENTQTYKARCWE